MKINDIIARHYTELLAMCTNRDTAIYDSKTSEDILNDCTITTINHFKDRDISEEEGFEYYKKTFLMEAKFSFKRKNSRIIYTDNLNAYKDKVSDI